tara:strand:- start:690 stop:1331 length:642 start_codon:yes stop_codon:yes gene_type:complete
MILFDGCSWTYGDELANPEENRFSTLIGKPHINLGQCGKSNDGILRTTIEYCEKNEVDIAVIQFTAYSRTEFRCERTDDYYYFSVGGMTKGKSPVKEMSKIYYEHLHNTNLHIANYHKNKFLLENYFKLKGIKHYFVNLERYIDLEGTKTPSSWYNIMDKTPVVSLRRLIGDRHKVPENYCQGRYKNDDKHSGGHPNEKGHRIIADHISENIF